MTTFSKPPLDVEKQIQLLETRGVTVQDRDIAKRFLLHCNYYRFSGYALHFENFDSEGNRTHSFKQETTFKDIVSLYEFDDRLRTILFDYIGHIEIAARAVMCNVIALHTSDPHWHLDASLFVASFNNKNIRSNDTYISQHDMFLNKLNSETKRSREIFIKSYNEKYRHPKHPPSWMMVEILPMGNWSRLYQNLNDHNLKKEIADHFVQTPKIFQSWIHALSVLRNHCAHHNRIWNRNFHISPTLIRQHKKIINRNSGYSNTNYTKLVSFLIVMTKLLKIIGRDEKFKNEIYNLFTEYKSVPLEKMGLSLEILKKIGI